MTPAEKNAHKTYELNGIVYLPHYKYTGYAYPGIGEGQPVSEEQLMKAGATETREWLYKRYRS